VGTLVEGDGIVNNISQATMTNQLVSMRCRQRGLQVRQLIITGLVVILTGALCHAGQQNETVAQVSCFVQQIHRPFTSEDGLPANDVLSISVQDESICAATSSGQVAFRGDRWIPLESSSGDGVVAAHQCSDGTVVVLNGQLHFLPTELSEFSVSDLESSTITCLVADESRLWVGTTDGLYQWNDGKLSAVEAFNQQLGKHRTVTGIVKSRRGITVAAQGGLFVGDGTNWQKVFPESGPTRWAPADVRDVEIDSKGELWFACPQGVGHQHSDGGWDLYTGAEGLPGSDFTCMAAGPNATMWFGTTSGAICFEDGQWGYRAGRRWLLDDDVREIAVSSAGDIWIATAGGVSCIEAFETNFTQKAAFFEDEIDQRHRRTSFGYVTNSGMSVPGDVYTATPFVTDNDGQYTGLYVGAECLGYAATGDPERKERAVNGFEALAFLSEVTQGGEYPAPPGFIARAVMPIDGPDPNEHDNPERDRKKRAEDDHLWKVLDPRWPVSADGRWYWKTDTSSDELDGHYFAYGLFFDHVAETEVEKERCREVVRRVTDHLIDHNYRLVDHDGTPTRWAHFAPEDLNDDPDWWTERGLNSLSVLTYLSVAHHVTGDQKYRDEYVRLAIDHHYALNGMVMPKLQFGPGSHVQFDDKMAFMNFYHLIRYETDPKLLRMYYTSIYYYWNVEKYELNPFFNFVYAACCNGKVRTDQWGDLDLTPPGKWLAQSVDTLKRYPLDLADWQVDNSQRLDILPLPDHVREPGGNRDKGYRSNGFVLPIDERQALSWSEDAWKLKDGGEGKRLRDGCPFLLAYYLGLHHGFITE